MSKFIIIDGPDGAGKTSVINALKGKFDPRRFEFTYEPFQKGLHEQVYISPIHKMLRFMYDREFHTKLRVTPALNAGINVICDRGITASIVYQGMELYKYWQKHNTAPINGGCNCLSCAMEFIYKMHEPWAVMPDMVILLDLSPEECIRRCDERGNEFYINDLEDICQGYECLPLRTPRIQDYHRIDASRPLEEVADDVLGIVKGVAG